MSKEEIHVVSTIVENKPGVLRNISAMFSRRGFNIESISAGISEQRDLTRITLTIRGDEGTLEQLVNQLDKLIDVIKVSTLDPTSTVVRELALIKVNTPDTRVRSDVINYTEIFKGHIVDVAHESLIIEITGDSDKINAFIELMRSYGVREIARTGITALPRGMRSVGLESEEGNL